VDAPGKEEAREEIRRGRLKGSVFVFVFISSPSHFSLLLFSPLSSTTLRVE